MSVSTGYGKFRLRRRGALRKSIINAWIPRVLATLFCFAPGYGYADFITVGTFEWLDSIGDQATHEANGNIFGFGTSYVEIGIPAEGFNPNMMEFTGVSGEGELPADFFNLGSITSFNGAIAFADPGLPDPIPIILAVSGLQCDDDGLNCVEVASGQTLIELVFRPNTDDIFESADSFCMGVFDSIDDPIPTSQCAWQFEETSHSFDLIGQFGSLIIRDIIPTTTGAFVTIGTDPTMNVIRAVPEPATLALFALGLLGMGTLRRSRVR